jgi:hypothetical protein
VSRAVPEPTLRQAVRHQVTTLGRLAVAGAVWAAATYVLALVLNRRLDLVASESLGDGEFQVVLMACGAAVWIVAGIPLVFGLMLVRAVGERMSARVVTGTVVFRGAFDPRRDVDDNRRVEYYVAVDDGLADHVPAYAGSYGTVSRVAEGDVVRASVTPAGRLLHLVVVDPAPATWRRGAPAG